MYEEKKKIKDKLQRTEDKVNKASNNTDKKRLNNELINNKKDLDKKSFNVTELEAELTKKNKNIKILEDNINNLGTEKNKEIQELQEELENTYQLINEKERRKQ